MLVCTIKISMADLSESIKLLSLVPAILSLQGEATEAAEVHTGAVLATEVAVAVVVCVQLRSSVFAMLSEIIHFIMSSLTLQVTETMTLLTLEVETAAATLIEADPDEMTEEMIDGVEMTVTQAVKVTGLAIRDVIPGVIRDETHTGPQGRTAIR